MAKYRKKPVVIEAFRLGIDEAPSWFTDKTKSRNVVITFDGVGIETLEGWMHARNGDYIIRGVKGEIYPCKADIFEMTYEEAL